MTRRIARWLATVLVVCLALIAVALVVATTPWFKEQVRALVVSRTSAMIDGEIEVGALTGSLFGYVTLQDVAIRQQGTPTIQIAALTARYDIVQVALGRYAIEVVEVRQPTVRLIEDRDGWNIGRLIRTRERQPDKAPWSIAVRRLEVTGGTLIVEPARRRPETMADLNLEGTLTYTAPRLDITLDRASLRDARTDLSVTQLAGAFSFDGPHLAVRDFQLSTPASTVRGHGSYRRGADPLVDVVLELAPVTTAEFSKYFPARASPSAAISGNLSAAGPPQAMAVAWNLDTRSGMSDGRITVGLDRREAIRLDGTVEVTRLNLAPLTGQARLASQLTARARLHGVLNLDRAVNSRFTFALDAPHVGLLGYEFRALRAQGALASRALRVKGDGRAYGAHATFDATANSIDNSRARRVNASGRVLAVNLDALPPALRAPRIPTDINGAYTLALGHESWRAEMTTQTSRIREAVIAKGTRVAAESQPGRFSASVDGSVTGLDGRLIGLPDGRSALLNGTIRGRISLPGLSKPIAIETVDAKLTANLSRSTIEGVSLDAFAVDVTMRPDHFSATVDGSVTGMDGRLLGLTEGRASLLGGTIRGRLALPGLARPIAIETVDAQLMANLRGFAIDDVLLETADVDASMRDGLVDVRQLDVRGADLVMTAKGPLALAGDTHQSKLTYQVGMADLSRLARVGVNDASGALQLDGTIEGPGRALATTGTFGTHQLKYRNLVDALALNGTFKAAVPERDWARLTADVELDSEFLTLRGYDVQRLAMTSRYQAGQIDLEGRVEQKGRAVELDGSLLFHPDHREVHLRQLTLAGPGSPWQLADGEAVIHYGSERVSVEGLTFTRDQERLEASGALVLSGAATSDLRLRFQGLQVGDVYTIAFGAPVVTGTADGTVDLRGTLQRLEVTGGFQVVKGQVGQLPYARAGAEVALRDKRLSVDARIDEPTGSTFTIKGAVPLAAEAGPLDVRVESAGMSLGLAQAFTSHLTKVQGQASVDLHATGTLTTPSLSGHVAVAGGGFLVTATGVTYRDLNADIEFQGQRAVAKQFAMTDDDGHVLTATGGADVFTAGKDRAFEIAIDARSLQVVQNELGDVEVDIAIRAEGGIAAPSLTGRIVLDQGRLEVDEVLRRIAKRRAQAPSELRPGLPATPTTVGAADGPVVTEAVAPVERVSEPQAAPTADTGLFSRATMDLDLVLPDALVLRGRDLRPGSGSMALGSLNITIGGELDLTKSPGTTPMIVGSLGVVRGFYEFQGRRFQVTRGSTVSFRGADPANPMLNVTGEREVQGVIARVQVTGSLRQPRLALSSDPALDEGDVLSLIVFNQPINQLGETEQVDLLDRAGALAMGTLATSLSDSIGRALDVDLFEIRAPGSGEAGELNVGRQINDRFYIGFQQQFAGGEASRLSFEYQLTDALRILTSVAQGVERAKRSRNQDTAGIDLVYLVRY